MDQEIKELIKKANKIVAQRKVVVVAQGSDAEVALFRAPCAGKVTGVGFIPDTAITGANTNYFTLKVINKGSAGVGTAAVASKAYTLGVDVVALDYESLGALTNVSMAKDDTLTFAKVETASGMATPALLAIVEFQPQWEAWKP